MAWPSITVRRSAVHDPVSESITTTFSIDTMVLRGSLLRQPAGRVCGRGQRALSERSLEHFADTGDPRDQRELLFLFGTDPQQPDRIGS